MKYIIIGDNDLRINLDQVVVYDKKERIMFEGTEKAKMQYRIVFWGTSPDATIYEFANFATEEARDSALKTLDTIVSIERID